MKKTGEKFLWIGGIFIEKMDGTPSKMEFSDMNQLSVYY